MKKCFCVIRVKLHATPEVFGKAVANLGYECYLVALNEKNEEVHCITHSKTTNSIYLKMGWLIVDFIGVLISG